MNPHSSSSHRSLIMLCAGCLAGILTASIGILDQTNSGHLISGAVAKVNDVFIFGTSYESQVNSLAADKRSPMRPEDEAHVLERLIEEELLVQRAIELDLLTSNRTARAALINGVKEMLLADVTSKPPTEKELQTFYEEHAELFRSPPRLRIRHLYFHQKSSHPDSAKNRAHAAYQSLLSGKNEEEVRTHYSDSPTLLIPDALLPLFKLNEYLGPTLLQEALKLPSGKWSSPVLLNSSYHLLYIAEKEIPPLPAFNTMREQVEMEYKKYRDDQAFQDYLKWLKKRANIIKMPPTHEIPPSR